MERKHSISTAGHNVGGLENGHGVLLELGRETLAVGHEEGWVDGSVFHCAAIVERTHGMSISARCELKKGGYEYMIRFLLLSLCCFSAAVAAPVSLKDGDMVVLLGDTFVEREGNYGFIESTITASNPGKTIRFRNLGWSGDTPNAQARSYLGPSAPEGQQRLKGNLELVKPTVVFCAYGSAIAAEGEAGIGKFVADYGKLLDLISQTTKSQIVLVSPAPAEAKGVVKPLMDVRNSQLAAVAGAVKKLAEDRKLGYIDLLTPLTKVIADSKSNLTSNWLHFTEAGYQQIAPAGGSPRWWNCPSQRAWCRQSCARRFGRRMSCSSTAGGRRMKFICSVPASMSRATTAWRSPCSIH